jgi:hypothetical protein
VAVQIVFGVQLARRVVTRRVIDWLLSIHAVPFVAEPVAVDTSKMSADQLRKLEAAGKNFR